MLTPITSGNITTISVGTTNDNKKEQAMWNYLDKMDKNLLYMYTSLLTGEQKQLHLFSRSEEELTEGEIHKREAQANNNGFYMVWFVYRYILGCETLEEALSLPIEEVIEKYGLKPFISSVSLKQAKSRHAKLYVGIDKDIPLWKIEDMVIVLEILYNRLDFWEQIDCFVKNAGTSEGKLNVRQKRCIEAKKRYMTILKRG